LRGIGEIRFFDTRRGIKLGGHTISQRDGSGLVEEQDIHVAGGFHCSSGHRQHIAAQQTVIPAIPIAESRPPMVVGIKQTNKEMSTNTLCGA